MTSNEIEEVAQGFSDLQIYRPDDAGNVLVAQKDGTKIHLKMEKSRLRFHQVYWVSGLMKVSCYMKYDLCSRKRLVELVVVSDGMNAGAMIFLDGELVGELSRAGTAILDVPVGEHTMTVKMDESILWSTKLHYYNNSSGCDRLVIPGLLKGNEESVYPLDGGM